MIVIECVKLWFLAIDLSFFTGNTSAEELFALENNFDRYVLGRETVSWKI